MLSTFSRAKLTFFLGVAFLFVFYFYFRARFPAFLFARVNLPIESKVWSRVARTNYMRTKQGYYMSCWTVPVVDPGEGPRGGPAPPLFLTKLRPESPKKFLRPAPGPSPPLSEGPKNVFETSPPSPPPLPPLSEGPDSPLYSVTLTKWTSYSYIYKFHQRLH